MATQTARIVDRIGTVTFRDGDQEVEAWLGRDGKWRATPSPVADYLNVAYSPNRAGQAHSHGFGLHSVTQAAEFLKGTASFPPPVTAPNA